MRVNRQEAAAEWFAADTTLGTGGAPAESADEPSPVGSTVGGYRIERELGRGGMGVVYLALHPAIGTRAAVKVLRQELAANGDVARRFVDEARAAAVVRHPNTVQIFDLTTLVDGRPCIVMEYVEGETLQARLDRAPPTMAESLEILVELCEALAAAHRHGVVHRDVKADNVLLVPRSGPGSVKLLDFGIAKLTAGVPGDDASQTLPGILIGTPTYMAPEQVQGQRVTSATDVYAVGVLGYRLLAGRFPFTVASAMDLMHAHVHALPEAPGVDRELDALLLRALEKEPEARFADCSCFADALRDCALSLGRRLAEPRTRTPAPEPAPARFTASMQGRVVLLDFASEEALEAARREELDHGRLLVPWPRAIGRGPLTLVLRLPDGRVSELHGELAVQFGSEEAARYGTEPGFAVALSRRTPRLVPPSAPPVTELERLVARMNEGHYAFLELDEGAPMSECRAAHRRVQQVLQAHAGFATGNQRARLAALESRLERARQVLCEPQLRAQLDAQSGNWRGVLQAIAGGLTRARLAHLRRSFAASFPERVRRANPHALAADVRLRNGQPNEAREELEAALRHDPLSFQLHDAYARATRAAQSASPAR